MANIVTQLVSGRIVSGNPYGRSEIVSVFGEKEHFYQITIAIEKDSAETQSFLKNAELVVKLAEGRIPVDFNWGFEEYHGYVGGKEPYVDYCLDCYLIHLREKQSPLTLMSDDIGGRKPVRHSGVIKVGDYVEIQLELIPNGDKVDPGLHLKPKYVALVKVGEKVDLEQDTAENHSKMLMAEVLKIFGPSSVLVD